MIRQKNSRPKSGVFYLRKRCVAFLFADEFVADRDESPRIICRFARVIDVDSLRRRNLKLNVRRLDKNFVAAQVRAVEIFRDAQSLRQLAGA